MANKKKLVGYEILKMQFLLKSNCEIKVLLYS